jgi:protein-S-isoprenylcysteine O-methyltransferase Ste14
MPAYRLGYNFVAVILLLPLLWLMWRNPGPLLWQWSGIGAWIMHGLALLAALGFIWSLRAYDGMVFLGWRQWQARYNDSHDPEPLHISSLHRFVRHPWYFFLLLLMWTQDLHLAQFVVYSLVSLYLVVGSRLEESKLLQYHGEAYARYRQRVPGLIPLPWRWLRTDEAAVLSQLAASQASQEKK